MNWNSIMGYISTLALFLPVILILAFRLGNFRSFPVLLAYYTLVFIYNLMTEHYIHVNADIIHYWGLGNNLLDAPLILWFLSYFSTSRVYKRRLKTLILSFIVFESAVVWMVGLNIMAITIILGPGILVVFGFCLYLFIRQSKIVITNKKARGKTLIVASLVIAYGCYGIIYMLYYVFKTSYVADTFLVYFLVSIFSSSILCAGINSERKRIRKLFELKKARQELHEVYKETTRVIPLRTAILDFDQEAWN